MCGRAIAGTNLASRSDGRLSIGVTNSTTYWIMAFDSTQGSAGGTLRFGGQQGDA